MPLCNFRSPALSALTFTGALLLTGCAGNSYFVDKNDLGDLNSALSRQQADITFIKQQTLGQHQFLIDQSSADTRKILDAIREQVEKPVCPSVPEAQACLINQDPGQGGTRGTDRLNGKVIVGEREKFFLVDPGLTYEARIDSGATTSSLDARNIRRFERDGRDWVRFDVPVPGSDGELKTMEREIARNARIIQSNDEDSERRPIVELQFAIGDHHQQAEFSLSDRAHLSHPVLIGRNILRDVMLIDVGKEYATELPKSLSDDGDTDN
ncbi:ATP-dependent zinc protease family protein [Marinobacter changyiensis]|uniref:ATP-dependent zinc protease family protein n=1 Tax=Marinobacter changyiensis TaxID=2604091 RepID=UPI001265A01B|nr:RimK/LysX family protein [Marinobacter changyiensis]